MQVWHGFPSILAIVDDKTESFVGAVETQLGGDFPCREEKMPQKFLILGLRFPAPRDRLLRNHKNVRRSLWRDISKRERLIIIVDDVSRNLEREKFLKQSHDAIRIVISGRARDTRSLVESTN